MTNSDKLRDWYKSCELCGRQCAVNRLSGFTGFCGESAALRIAAAVVHRGEEPLIVGQGGSGAIFFTGCNLGCAFCQNHQLSRGGVGRIVKQSEFVAICLALQAAGAENINLITGSHAIPAIATGLAQARLEGLALPVLWNSSAYESLAAIELIAPDLAIFLPDLKTLSAFWADRWFAAPNYPDLAKAAISQMVKLKPLIFSAGSALDLGNTSSRLVSGVIVRHLIMPGRLGETAEVLSWFANQLAGKALLSLMSQYTPIPALIGDPANRDIPDRFLGKAEFETVLAMLDEFGIEDGFYQELACNSDWLPDFQQPNPFASSLSQAIWHWRDGFLN